MDQLFKQISIKVNENVYQKDPESTELGQRILKSSIELMDEIGFEAFTFKKLGTKIGSPESTIYRYFENKHKLLIYLTAWYWAWLEYRLVFATVNIESPIERLKIAIKTVTEPVQEDSDFSHINEVLLNKIVISESAKAFLTKDVDVENEQGYFHVYKRLVNRIGDMVTEINSDFEYSRTLVSTVIEGAHQQKFFSEHLPSLTDIKKTDSEISRFFIAMVFSMISAEK